MVGEAAVLTAAHCLYHFSKSDQKYHPAHTVYFFPGMCSDIFQHQNRVANFLSVTSSALGIPSSTYFVHENYLDGDEHFDYSIVALPSQTGLKTGYAGLIVLDDLDLHQKDVSVTGYPAYRGFCSAFLGRQDFNMFSMRGPVTACKKNKFYYRIDTSGGQSGAGVWSLSEEHDIDCYGVHVTGCKEEGNGAIRINPSSFETLLEWLGRLRLS